MKKGNFSWYDLMTSDPDAAASFYREVVGWHTTPAPAGDRPYTIFSMGEANVGGLMPIPEAARKNGVKPCWTGYILVDDVDACAERIKALNGAVHSPPEDIPGVLRFAVVADPHGATFIIFKGMSDQTGIELAPDAIGNIGWHELNAGDCAGDFHFYEQLFGWTKVQAIDMGGMGVYQTFAAAGSDGKAVGGMMTAPADTPTPMWLYYFNVDHIDAAVERTIRAGGKIRMGPHEVPSGQWIVVGNDPQGAQFALLAAAR